MKNIIFICQAVDKNDSILASSIGLIREFALQSEIEKVTVLTLRQGDFTLPENVQVYTIKEKTKLATIIKFYKKIFKHILQTDYYFIYMGGHYPLLLLPIKLLFGKSIYQWKAHPKISLSMRFYAYFCDTKIFTSVSKAFPLKLTKVKVVGQGVDIDQFDINDAISKTEDLISVGRISQIKHIEKSLIALATCNQLYNTHYRLNIYGPIFDKNQDYKHRLDQLVTELNLSQLVKFRGAVSQEQLPAILNQHQLMISFNGGALDRSVVEAMACGLPVITPNQCMAEVLPKQYDFLIISEDHVGQHAEAIHQLMSLSKEESFDLGQGLRSVIKENHSLKSLVAKIIKEINNHET
jgi:glycosyltransferase involved in cell wall biosynthesis